MAGILKGRGALAKQTKKMQEARKQEAKQSGGLTGGRSGNNIAATLARIKLTTQQYLSKYIDQYLLLRTEDEVIEYIFTELRKIPHVEIVRLGSRSSVVMPMRITDKLCDMIKKFHPVWLNTHFNHPKEMTPQAEEAPSQSPLPR